MPPKKSLKNQKEAKAKAVDDKTFGLKNKNKSTKVGKYVQQVQQQVDASGNRKDKVAADTHKATIAAKKAQEAAKKAELAELFKPVIAQQKVPFGVDPKTIVCAFFKAGSCQKGTRCKFSHDLDIERKAAKVDMYTDSRDKEKEEDNMDDWDQAKLESAINEKHGSSNANKNKPTDIVCKFFLEAIDLRKYGWFWECPNGKSCKYRHALPPGFILKKKETHAERTAREEMEKENEISIEDFLETERHKLGSNVTPVTAESFAKWKKERKEREAADMAAEGKRKKEAYDKLKAGMKSGMTFSGRELFDFNPEWAVDEDEDEGAIDVYQREDQDDEDVKGKGKETARAEVEQDEPPAPVMATNGVNEDLFEGDDLAGLDDDDSDDDSDDE